MIDPKFGFSLSILGDVLAMRMGRSVAGTVRKFNPDPRVAQMLDHFTQYVGSCPEQSPAVLCGIAHMQTQRRHLVSARRHPRRAGGAGEVRRENWASSIAPKRGVARDRDGTARSASAASRPRPVKLIELAAVVSNADSVRTHRELLARDRAASGPRSSSAAAATNRPVPASCSISG